MSGTPSEAQIQDQWKKAINILETFRAHVDGTHAGDGNLWDTLVVALKGDYLPVEMAQFVETFRGQCSALISPALARQVMEPILAEYAALIDTEATGTQGFGSGYRSAEELFRTLYDWFIDNTLTVESRAIAYDVTATTSGTGNGAMSRLTVDENGHDLEACTVEKKRFRCVADQNTGQNELQEIFEALGEAPSPDSVLRASFGSGAGTNTTFANKHAGQGAGGSLLANSSFSEYTAAASPEFTGWVESAVPAGSLDQDLTNFYVSHPGAQTDASLEITGGLGTVTIKQPLTSMRVRRLDADTPYMLRVMFNPTIGTAAAGGSLTIRCGSNSATIAVSAMAGGWEELALALDANLWARAFNEDAFDVEIEWSGSTSGTLLVDDVIFVPMDLIDGTYWFLRMNHATPVSWLMHDALVFTDTGGAPATGKIQWWLYVAGLGYLPSSGTPSLADPT
tara:strand:- start:23844 stop:25202 length:1359 start_codon:yes stop_codon:yes gene_type:complete